MTVQCARCHDHKFDPILQQDYYRMQASIFGYVEVDWPLLDREELVAYRRANADVDTRQQPLKDALATLEAPYRDQLKLERIRERFPENVQQAALKPESERTPGEQLLAAQRDRSAPRFTYAISSEDAVHAVFNYRSLIRKIHN